MNGVSPAGIHVAQRGPESKGHEGKLPEAMAKELRALLVRSLRAGGFSLEGTAQLVGVSRATVARIMVEEGPQVDDSIPPDEPPGHPEPGPRKPPPFVTVSEAFIARLRKDYRSGRPTDDGRLIGDEADVKQWLAGLRPGRHKP